MISEIKRIPDPENSNSEYIQRLKNGAIETIKETTHTTGEVIDPNNELVTTETITITRLIGEKIQF